MTEKRFKYIGNGIYWDNVEEKDVGTGEVVRLANDMYDEYSKANKDRVDLFYKEQEVHNELRAYKQKVKEVLQDEYDSAPNTVWNTYIGNLAIRLGVDLDD